MLRGFTRATVSRSQANAPAVSPSISRGPANRCRIGRLPPHRWIAVVKSSRAIMPGHGVNLGVLAEHDAVTSVMNQPHSIEFVTRELTPREMLLQAGWAKSKSGLLDRLDVDGSRILIRRRNGAVDEIRQGEFRCTTYRTRAGRRLFVIKTNDGRKIQFLEMDGMLSVAQWDTIATEILEAKPSQLTNIVTRAGLSVLLGMLVAAFSAGFVGGLLGLKDEQLRIGSPLCLGLIGVWTTAWWLGLRRLFK